MKLYPIMIFAFILNLFSSAQAVPLEEQGQNALESIVDSYHGMGSMITADNLRSIGEQPIGRADIVQIRRKLGEIYGIFALHGIFPDGRAGRLSSFLQEGRYRSTEAGFRGEVSLRENESRTSLTVSIKLDSENQANIYRCDADNEGFYENTCDRVSGVWSSSQIEVLSPISFRNSNYTYELID